MVVGWRGDRVFAPGPKAMEAGRHLGSNPDRSRIVAGKYRLLSVLGQGGMGTVWRAEHLQLGAPVAVKLIDPKAAGGVDALRLCQKEARAAAALRSPHVVQVLDFGSDDATGSPFIVMELLEGESLADRLVRRGKLSPAETSRVLTHVARALSRAHDAGIIHRDLKPANVFLVRNDDEELAKVLDFGIAPRAAPGQARCNHGRDHGQHRRHASLHEPRAHQRADPRSADRPLGHGRDGLRVRHRPAALRRQERGAARVADLHVSDACSLGGRAGARRLRHLVSTRHTARARPALPVGARVGGRPAAESGGRRHQAPVDLAAARAARATFRLAPPTDRASAMPRRRRRPMVRWLGGGALVVAILVGVAARSALDPGALRSDPVPAPAPATIAVSSPPVAVPAPPVVPAAAVPMPARPSVKRQAGTRATAAPSAAAPESAAAPNVESVLDHRR